MEHNREEERGEVSGDIVGQACKTVYSRKSRANGGRGEFVTWRVVVGQQAPSCHANSVPTKGPLSGWHFICSPHVSLINLLANSGGDLSDEVIATSLEDYYIPNGRFLPSLHALPRE